MDKQIKNILTISGTTSPYHKKMYPTHVQMRSLAEIEDLAEDYESVDDKIDERDGIRSHFMDRLRAAEEILNRDVCFFDTYPIIYNSEEEINECIAAGARLGVSEWVKKELEWL
jgi:hypothetical protein